MTRVAVFSDTHGDISLLSAAMAHIEPVQAFLHLGDYGCDAGRMADILHLPYHAVRGNCDASSDLPRERLVQYEKAVLYLTHGNQYSDIYALACRAEENRSCAALFGHTHTPLLTANGSTLIINPGSLSRPRYLSRPSFCVLSIEGATVQVQMVTL